MNRFFDQVDKGKNDWWRYMAVILVFFVGWQFIGVIPLLVAGSAMTENEAEFAAAMASMFQNIGLSKNAYLTLMLLTFVIGFFFLKWGIERIHKRSVVTVLTGRDSIDWSRISYSFLLWLGISIAGIIVDYWLHTDSYVVNFDPSKFFILLLIAISLIPIQTSMEELLFRGYLMQGLGKGFGSAGVALFVTSVSFGLMHVFNPEVQILGSEVLIYYIATGFLFGITTLMDDGTELALGMHAANNISAALLVTVDWAALQTDALLIDTSEPALGMDVLLPVFVLYPIVLFVFARKYQWTEWKRKLLGNVEE